MFSHVKELHTEKQIYSPTHSCNLDDRRGKEFDFLILANVISPIIFWCNLKLPYKTTSNLNTYRRLSETDEGKR